MGTEASAGNGVTGSSPLLAMPLPRAPDGGASKSAVV